MSRTMPAACGITEEEEERRRLVAQVHRPPTWLGSGLGLGLLGAHPTPLLPVVVQVYGAGP